MSRWGCDLLNVWRVGIIKNMNKKAHGFTIVELLIVIVVIGILAAITIVAFNGVQQRAQATKMTSAVEKYAKALAIYRTNENAYPITTSQGIGCFDGTVSCWGSANQAASTALLAGVRTVMPSAPLDLPYRILVTHTSAIGYYILYQIPSSQTCPASIAGTVFVNSNIESSNGMRNCRMSLPEV